MTEEFALEGGIANAGQVVRVGAHVLRPTNPHTAAIHRFLSALRNTGFDGAPRPVGVERDGRERLDYLEGDVGVSPYPKWAQRDDALASIAELLRRFHEAARVVGRVAGTWSDEMADPVGGVIVCHNDVCLENVVFRNGVAVALLDFDFAAPGRPAYDLAQMARMCTPIDDEVNAPRLGWDPVDKPARLRLVADAYRLDASGRGELLHVLSESIERGGAFVRRRVEAGDPNFVRMWTEMGGEERFERRRRWWEHHRSDFERALV
jgi:aminoglycoside phosphotransferase (APT) family kinase protein